MDQLRREVELPARLPRRAWFYLGVASLLFSFSIVADAALWARPTVDASRAAATRRLHLRPPCVDRAPAVSLPAPGEYHEQLVKQLEHPWAGSDDLSPAGRYDNADRALDDGAPGQDQNVVDSLKRSGIGAGRVRR